MKYPVANPDLNGNESQYVMDALSSSWISSQGPFLGRFERMVADYVGVANAVAVVNGTAALHLALMALRVMPGDEVIVPSLTYVATANAVRYCGGTPVFADSDPASWCIDPDSVARLITARTRGIIAVHLFGQPCDMEALRDLADRHNLWLVEDAAEALGAEDQESRVGSLGDLATFSFFGNKTVTTGEGGMVVTDRHDLAQQIRLLCNQGTDPAQRYWHPVMGYNYRMTNVAAAIGVAQMERLDAFLACRRSLVRRYRQRLRTLDLVLPADIAHTVHGNWMFGVLVSDQRWRDPLMSALAACGVETRPFFYPTHHLPMYRNGRIDGNCSVACDLSRRGLCLPTSSVLSETDANIIAGRFIAALANVSTMGSQARAA
jgi:perosamine synthetase